MIISSPTEAAPSVVPAFPDSGHTCVSCPHQDQQYPRNSLSPKNGCPNRASSAIPGTAEISSSMAAPSTDPADPISTSSAEPLPPNAHDLAVRSTPPLRTRHIHKSPGCFLLSRPSQLHAICGTDTSAPRQRDTDSAILCVITFETGCSLFSPLFSKLRQQLESQANSERLFQPCPSGTGIASPHHHTHRVWVSTSH